MLKPKPSVTGCTTAAFHMTIVSLGRPHYRLRPRFLLIKLSSRSLRHFSLDWEHECLGPTLKIYRKLRSVESVDAGVQQVVGRQTAFITVRESNAREDRKSQNNCCTSQDHRVIRPSARHTSSVGAHKGSRPS